MISYSLKKIADVTGGTIYGDENACINGVCIDSREIKPHELFIPIIGERVNGHRFVADLPDNCSLWQKGEPDRPDNINIVEVDDVVTALQKLAAHYRREFKGKVIGVTGSSGKTSTKDIISSVLSTRFRVHKTSGNQNNEIGVPRTILSINEDDDIAVVEMGISGIGEMEQLVDIVLPDITIITSMFLKFMI